MRRLAFAVDAEFDCATELIRFAVERDVERRVSDRVVVDLNVVVGAFAEAGHPLEQIDDSRFAVGCFDCDARHRKLRNFRIRLKARRRHRRRLEKERGAKSSPPHWASG